MEKERRDAIFELVTLWYVSICATVCAITDHLHLGWFAVYALGIYAFILLCMAIIEETKKRLDIIKGD